MNNRKLLMFIYIIVLTVLIPFAIYPCTTFVFHHGNSLVFGRNLDWYCGSGLVMLNPRNLEKVALVNPSEKPVKWV